LPYYFEKLALALGAVLGVLFLIGVGSRIVREGPRRGLWAAAGAFIIAVIVFQSIAPVGLEARHLIPIVPAALMFSVAGFDFLARGWPRVALCVVALAGVGWALFPLNVKGDAGFQPLVDKMLADAGRDDVALVSSDATGEGIFIADVALREQRPGHTIQRASKSLASSTWSGSGYTALFSTDDALFRFLTDGKIQYLVVDDAVPSSRRREHHDQIRRVVEQHPDCFGELAAAEAWREGQRQKTPVRLYKISTKN
jgi:hypothetical protein